MAKRKSSKRRFGVTNITCNTIPVNNGAVTFALNAQAPKVELVSSPQAQGGSISYVGGPGPFGNNITADPYPGNGPLTWNNFNHTGPDHTILADDPGGGDTEDFVATINPPAYTHKPKSSGQRRLKIVTAESGTASREVCVSGTVTEGESPLAGVLVEVWLQFRGRVIDRGYDQTNARGKWEVELKRGLTQKPCEVYAFMLSAPKFKPVDIK